ncbi:phage tail tape measure protein, TP901 family, core region [Cohnella sp. OV330]|uniref:phage tail tape measure protein n=1 Tax=Cohnella sp. OV330 TaxID=1855288 RepID=UPI0008E08801|nr:phage tail tape measure protein [Cohnella sp. OV330]SFA91518.1 phage tail tape measure protein, TP901 family, core region [Cohnella sp. OV330]
MSKEYELAFRLNAELDAKFSRVFTNAADRLNSLERQIHGLDRVGRSGPKFGSGIVSGLESIARMTTKVSALAAGGIVFGGAAAAGYAIKSSMDKAMEFEAEMSTIQALTGSTTAEMAKYQALALKMGADTKYSAMEAAKAIEELLKAGMQPATVQAGGLNAALNLATAGGLDLAEAAATMATSLNAFKKDGMKADDAANILAGTANASATSVHELGYALASAGGVANMAGLSFLDLNTAIGLMSNDGLKGGSDAGTSFKSMLSYLQPKTKEATKLFLKLGIGVDKANKFFSKGKIKDIAGIADVMHKAFAGMSEQERTAKMMDMFGTDGVKAASTLYKAGAKGVKEFQKAMSDVTALDVAKKKMDNAAGSVEQFKGAIETLQISALLPTMPIIKRFASAAADFVTKYTPQITAGVDQMVQRSKSYLNEHFFDNAEFKKLHTFESKIDFVYGDIMASLSAWWDSSGREAFINTSEKIGSTLAQAIASTAPDMFEAGAKLGGALATGIWKGLEDSPLGKFSPQWVDDLWAKANGEDVSWGDVAGDFMKGPLAKDREADRAKTEASNAAGTKEFVNRLQNPAFPTSGTVNPKLVNSHTTVNYSPNINIQGNADKSTVEQVTRAGSDSFAQFVQQQNAWQKRVSMSQ